LEIIIMKSSVRGEATKLYARSKATMEEVSGRLNAQRILDSGILRDWESRHLRPPVPKPRSECQQRADAKRIRKDCGDKYKNRMETIRRYEKSIPVPPKRPWLQWEKDFVAANPFRSCRELGLALNRSFRSIINERDDPDGKKRKTRRQKTEVQRRQARAKDKLA
jgi:hypothetical protein